MAQIIAIRNSINPSVKLDIDEIGGKCYSFSSSSSTISLIIAVILPSDNNVPETPFPLVYWNAAAAEVQSFLFLFLSLTHLSPQYAYIYGNLAAQNVDWLGMSQLIGYPGQFPRFTYSAMFSFFVSFHWFSSLRERSVSMLNWTTGEPTARYSTLRMLHDFMAPPQKMIQTYSSSEQVSHSLSPSLPRSFTVSFAGICSGLRR